MFLIKTSNERLLCLIGFYFFYIFFGAFMFDQLESPHEARIIKELNQYVKEFRKRHDACLTDEQLNSFIKLVSIANDKGVPATRNVSKEQNWSFGQAVFFAGTVLTTIGYGDITVQTQFGKVFCIIFALVGIPATLLLLYAIIERLMKLTSFLLGLFTDLVHPLLKNVSLFSEKIQRSHMHVLFALFCTTFVLIFFFLIPAAVYSSIEGWSYLNAFYYCFISLSTVGLGDYVPGDGADQRHRHLYKIFSTMYLIIGVMVMVWLLQIFSETPEFNFYKYFTLTKDGILTSHRETVHTASQQGTDSFASIDKTNSSKITYQQQLDETNGAVKNDHANTTNKTSSLADDEVNLNLNNRVNNYSSMSGFKQ